MAFNTFEIIKRGKIVTKTGRSSAVRTARSIFFSLTVLPAPARRTASCWNFARQSTLSESAATMLSAGASLLCIHHVVVPLRAVKAISTAANRSVPPAHQFATSKQTDKMAGEFEQ